MTNVLHMCFGIYYNDGEEWIQCAWEKWIHDDCRKSMLIPMGKRRFALLPLQCIHNFYLLFCFCGCIRKLCFL